MWQVWRPAVCSLCHLSHSFHTHTRAFGPFHKYARTRACSCTCTYTVICRMRTSAQLLISPLSLWKAVGHRADMITADYPVCEQTKGQHKWRHQWSLWGKPFMSKGIYSRCVCVCVCDSRQCVRIWESPLGLLLRRQCYRPVVWALL